MLVQPMLPVIRAKPRHRNVRRPFRPSQPEGSYRLPREIADRLATNLAGYKNREAAFTLAVFIARWHSAPRKIVEAFPLDRRALANIPDLDLTERQARSAIRVLEEIGFLDRALASGSKFKATEDGLRRKPILFMFGNEGSAQGLCNKPRYLGRSVNIPQVSTPQAASRWRTL
ncbi:hypothetical protein ACFSM9_11990, partial [Microvirga arabica]